MGRKKPVQIGQLLGALSWVVLAVGLGSLVSRYLISVEGPLGGDFLVYLKAVDRARQGIMPYVLAETSPYKYSPGALALFRMLPEENPLLAWRLFIGLNLVGLGAVFFRAMRWRESRERWLFILGLALAWKGILENFDYGQIEFLMWILVVGTAVHLQKQPWLSGILAGILPAFKLPWLLLVVPLALAARAHSRGTYRWFCSGAFFAWVGWLVALPSITFGAERTVDWTRGWIDILRAQPPELYLNHLNQSLASLSLRAFGPTFWAVGFGLILAGVLLAKLMAHPVFGVSTLPVRTRALAWVSPWLLLIQLINPLAWRWGSLFLVGIPHAWDQSAGRRNWRSPLVLTQMVLIFLLWAIQQNPVAHLLGVSHWTAYHGLSSITVYWLAALLVSLRR